MIECVYHFLTSNSFFYCPGKISISVSGEFFIPKNSKSQDDINTAERANQFEVYKHFSYLILIYTKASIFVLERLVQSSCVQRRLPSNYASMGR